jgi:SWIM zinc finger
VEKAVQLVLFRSIERGDAGRVWWVGSETTPDTTYAVADASCECLDHQKRGGPCAHQLAVTLVTRLERVEADAGTPIDLELTEAAYAAIDALGEPCALAPLCSRCGQDTAVPSHIDHLCCACISRELFGESA